MYCHADAADHSEHVSIAEIVRWFMLQLLCAWWDCDRRADRESADLDQPDAGQVDRRGGREELLRHARRAKAGRYRPAQREPLDRLEARRDLAVHRVAEVGEMFVAAGDLDVEPVAQVGVEFDIAGERSEEHTSEPQSLIGISYAVLFL